MSKLRHFALVEGIVLLSLIVTAGAMAAFGAAQSLSYEDSLLSPTESAWVLFGYTAVLGFLPALLLGGPAYFVLLRIGEDRWFYVLLAGVLPGIGAVPFEASLASWVIVCGGSVALITHGLHQWLGPNNSLKRTDQSLRD